MLSQNDSNRWKKFKKQTEESFLSRKAELLIIIYGAYKPLVEEERLIALRDFLKDEGYVSTYIVKEFPTDGNSVSPNLSKSLECLEVADLNILVFTCRGNTDSVTIELKHAIDNDLLSKCKVFEEVHNGITAMGTLPKEGLIAERYEVVQFERQNDNDLHEHALGDVLAFFTKFAKRHM
ncbi:hypothetical protein [Methanococcoides seepicolus]|uniref:Uncharacterized protein n=1 Tax=Methanococcoides seepicolus TaxID=2828780 RepID=A0A9E4ZGQ1_9EURY|nr:hypothetical protein [Methanococcoides seepicolus]MCM1987756.1 hypothetical protein [Methanococcoides seepicolus]